MSILGFRNIIHDTFFWLSIIILFVLLYKLYRVRKREKFYGETKMPPLGGDSAQDKIVAAEGAATYPGGVQYIIGAGILNVCIPLGILLLWVAYYMYGGSITPIQVINFIAIFVGVYYISIPFGIFLFSFFFVRLRQIRKRKRNGKSDMIEMDKASDNATSSTSSNIPSKPSGLKKYLYAWYGSIVISAVTFAMFIREALLPYDVILDEYIIFGDQASVISAMQEYYGDNQKYPPTQGVRPLLRLLQVLDTNGYYMLELGNLEQNDTFLFDNWMRYSSLAQDGNSNSAYVIFAKQVANGPCHTPLSIEQITSLIEQNNNYEFIRSQIDKAMLLSVQPDQSCTRVWLYP